MGSQAIELYRKIPPDLVNARTYACVLKACANSRLLDEAREIFDKASTKTERMYTEMVKENGFVSY